MSQSDAFGRDVASSILFRISGLVLAAVAAALVISFGIVVFTPPPPAPQVSLLEVRDALLDQTMAEAVGFRRTVSSIAPFGPSGPASSISAAALAYSLGVPRANVRVRTEADRTSPEWVLVSVTSPGQPQRTSVDDDPARAGVLEKPALFRAMLNPMFNRPPFEAALQRSDGSWVLIEPTSVWLSVWRIRVLAAFGLSALLLAPIAWFASRRLTEPIRALAGFARQADLGATASPPLKGPWEVQAAVSAIADMRARLQDQAAERVRMLAAVAHDLRNPLTGLRLWAEAAPVEARERMAADIGRMEAMITQVIAYAGEKGDEPRERLDLAALARECVEDGVAWGQDASFAPRSPLLLNAAPISLRRAVANLVDNAARYGGTAEVSIVEESDWVVIKVEDRGPGLRDDLLELVTEPFFRADNSRSRQTGGVGLGLAIAKSIAHRHGGNLMLSNRSGGGLVAELRVSSRACAL